MLNYDQYYMMSRQVVKDMPVSLLDCYNDYVSKSELFFVLQTEMHEWVSLVSAKSAHYDGQMTLENFIWYIMCGVDATKTVASIRQDYADLRRFRKRYFLQVNEQELGKASSQIRQDCKEYFAIMRKNRSMKQYKTEDEFCKEKYAKIVEYCKDLDTDLVDYEYFVLLQPARAAKCFQYDVAYHVYDIILNKYFSNPIDGMLAKLPKSIVDNGVFALQNRDADLQYDVSGEEVIAYTDHKTRNSGKNQNVRTVIDRYTGNFLQAIENNTKESLISDLKVNGQIAVNAKLLDATDETIISNIYSTFSVEDINKGSKIIPLGQLVGGTYKERRIRNYEATLARLDKLAKCYVNVTTVDQKMGTLVSAGTFSFFDVFYHVPQKEADSDMTLTSLDVTDGTSGSSVLDTLIRQDPDVLSSITVEFQPSKFIKDTWKKNMNVSVMSTIYAQIVPPRAKAMLFLLQSKRSDIYPDTSCVLPFSYFVDSLRLENLRKSQIKKALCELFDMLIGSEVIIKKYVMTGSGSIAIDFIPFSETEKILYKIENLPKEIPENKD
jgi:hypothetical protein